MTTPTEALRACLALMDRAAPHPDDADRWHITMREASKLVQAGSAPLLPNAVCQLTDLAAQLRADLGVKAIRRRKIIIALIAAGGLLAIAAGAARAQDRVTWPPTYKNGLPSVLHLAPTKAPGAVAEVRFMNEEVHNFTAADQTLTLDGLTVAVSIDINRAGGMPDTITVTPPEGFIAVPPSLTVAEGDAGRIIIYSTETPAT